MTIKIRPADLEADRNEVLALVARHLNPAYDGRRFDWLYRANPAGPGRLWLAVEGSTGQIIGAAGAFPRRMCVGGRPVVGWVLGDFCIHLGHRTLGPALLLQRACLDDLAADGVPFCYDFPSPSMQAVYRRLGIPLGGDRLLRLARPLRARNRLIGRWGDSMLIRAVASAADLVLARAARPSAPGGALGVEVQPGPCGDEFSALARIASTAYGVCAERSAEYLQWRYRDTPVQHHEIICTRQAGALVAYAVLAHEAGVTTVVDLFGVPDPRYLRVLLRGIVARAWKVGSATVSVSLLDSHPWLALCRRLGFRPRESSAIMRYAPPDSALGTRAIVDTPWFLTLGDRDA